MRIIAANMAKIIGFLAALVLASNTMTSALWLKDDGYSAQVFSQFYAMPEESLDYVIFGSSAAREYYMQQEAYRSAGIAGYVLATSNQPFSSTRFLIEEVEKTQSPSLYLVEIRELTNTSPLKEGDVRKVTDNMHFNTTRSKAVVEMLKNLSFENPDVTYNKWDYFLSMSTYHTRWKELTELDFTPEEELPVWSGFSVFSETLPVDYYGLGDPQPEALAGYRDISLHDFLDYCDTIDTRVVFFCTTACFDDPKPGRIRYIKDTVESRGYEFWNMNDPAAVAEIGLDFTTEMRNATHVNFYGAQKVTDYMARHLRDDYGMPDHTGEEKYQFWLEEYEKLWADAARQEAEKATAAAAEQEQGE